MGTTINEYLAYNDLYDGFGLIWELPFTAQPTSFADCLIIGSGSFLEMIFNQSTKLSLISKSL
jgi:hypothetical protein